MLTCMLTYKQKRKGPPGTTGGVGAASGTGTNTEGADELLVQFETDSQTLPPENSLNR